MILIVHDMNIIQALEANKTKRVRIQGHNHDWHPVGRLRTGENIILTYEQIEAKWEIENTPPPKKLITKTLYQAIYYSTLNNSYYTSERMFETSDSAQQYYSKNYDHLTFIQLTNKSVFPMEET